MDPQAWREQLRFMSLEDLREMISRKLDDYESTGPEDKTVALLRALSDWAPSEEGRRNVAIDILTCSTNNCLRAVAERYRIGLILPIRAAGGTTPRLSDHPSKPSTDVDDIVKTWLLQPTTCDRRTMQELIFRRDNYRWTLTGKCDLDSVQDKKTKVEEGVVGITILERPTSFPSPWYLRLKIHRQSSDPAWFGRGIKPELFAMLRLPDTVTFIPRSDIPVPDPRYLALHAACAKVVHESGMAEILDNLLRELERTSVLSTDGSTAHLLRHALEIIAVPSAGEGSA
ncbi:hypothetical protein FRC04_007552 [Tulasnella sp. 424]|nr:hypothetical protein FRC04_007552 [Tulasnella sp. 424]KAG8978987.1 hypothetical protein FRC05_009197 [Tulasnella sp. 425]